MRLHKLVAQIAIPDVVLDPIIDSPAPRARSIKLKTFAPWRRGRRSALTPLPRTRTRRDRRALLERVVREHMCARRDGLHRCLCAAP